MLNFFNSELGFRSQSIAIPHPFPDLSRLFLSGHAGSVPRNVEKLIIGRREHTERLMHPPTPSGTIAFVASKPSHFCQRPNELPPTNCWPPFKPGPHRIISARMTRKMCLFTVTLISSETVRHGPRFVQLLTCKSSQGCILTNDTACSATKNEETRASLVETT
jgi:hypothetical protein